MENKTFKYMKALLILMVIDDHVGSQIGILSSVFPYNSFYMPLFVCVSGYFFKNKPIITDIKKLSTNLLLPYIIWSVIGNFFSMILASLNISDWYRAYDIESCLQLFTYGTFSSITYAGWFAIMLFWVRILYSFLRKILIEKLWIDYMLLILLSVASIISVKVCMSESSDNVYQISFFRLFFFLLFYHVGYMFRKYWETNISKYNGVVVCFFCMAVNIFLISIYGDEVNFYTTKEMNRFNSSFLPYVTFITGGLFWYEICTVMAEKIGDNDYVDFLSENTFTIMMSHLFFTNIPNYFIVYLLKYKNIVLANFNYEYFYHSAPAVRYNMTTSLIGFLFAVVGCYWLCKVIGKTKNRYKQFINRNKIEEGE